MDDHEDSASLSSSSERHAGSTGAVQSNGRRPAPITGMMNEETLQSFSRSRRVRAENSNSWEDIESSDEEGGGREANGADGWEDENSSDEESDGAVSSATTTVKQASSAKKALRDYRESKQALMKSESNNMERYNRLMKGDQHPTIDDINTPDVVRSADPFSAGRGVESIEQANRFGRAHDAQLQDDKENRALLSPDPIRKRPSVQQPTSHSHSRKGSTSRSSFLDGRTASRSPSPSANTALSDMQGDLIERDDKEKARGRNGYVKEAYASEPASPTSDQDRRPWQDSVPKLNTADDPVSSFKDEGGESHTKSASSEMLSSQLDQLADASPTYSLWDYLKEEVMASDFDSTQELKWERVTNFIAIPFWMEKIMVFGFAVCLDSFLYTFTILPLRSLVAFIMWVRNTLLWVAGGQKRYLHSSHKCDMLKALLIILSCYILSQISDASKMYHSVRGQDVVKLYVIFNVLEIADRLCCSFGQDLLDTLFSRLTLARRKDGGQPYLRPLGFFLLSLGYVLAHTLVLFYQLVCLNVAINSYDNALLTLLLSNQFVEIKGSVFKKFEKENLFQLTCADIVERFQLTLMLSAIGLRNLIEVSGASSSSPSASSTGGVDAANDLIKNTSFSSLSTSAIFGPLPTSFTVFPSFSLLETIFTPVCIVLASECLVDWLKHAFITKFNHIRPSVYGRFMDVLCRDLTIAGKSSNSRKRHTFVDQSPVVSRRLGFAAIPLACLLVRMTSQILGMLRDDSHFDECAMPEVHRQADQIQAQGMIGKIVSATRTSIVMVVGAFTSQAGGKVDLAFNYLFSASAWILTILIAWVFLVAVKLLLGTNLVSYASHRYSTMDQREKEEELNARDRKQIGVDKEEKAYENKVLQLIDKREDNASKIGLNGQPVENVPYKKDKSSGNFASLMDVDRYSMIRSRIW